MSNANPTNDPDNRDREVDVDVRATPAEGSGSSNGSLSSAQRAAYRQSLQMPRWRPFQEIGPEDHGWFVYSEPPYRELKQFEFSPIIPGRPLPESVHENEPFIFPYGTLFYGPLEPPCDSEAADAFIVSECSSM